MPRDQRHTSAYLFGAVCPARCGGAGLVLPFANTEMMNLHLGEISVQVAPGVRGHPLAKVEILIRQFSAFDRFT